MIGALLRTPRPAPSRIYPAAAGATLILFALPIYLILHWRVAGWGLAAALFAGSEVFTFVIGRMKIGVQNLTRSGFVAFAMMFRAIAVMIVLIAVAVKDGNLALGAALLFALAYTLELGLSLTSYFTADNP